MSEDVTLLPCPFCGGAANTHANDWCEPPLYSVFCSKCFVSGTENEDVAVCIRVWNDRPPVPGWLEAKEACAKAVEENARRATPTDRLAIAGAKIVADEIRALTPPGVRGEKKD